MSRADLEIISAYSEMFDGVRKLTLDLLNRVRDRAGEALTEQDAEVLNIASELTELMTKTNDAIQRAMQNDRG